MKTEIAFILDRSGSMGSMRNAAIAGFNEFLFLGANQDAIATAAQMGIHAHSSATFNADADDLKASNEAFAYKISSSLRHAAKCNLAVAESDAVHESMTESLEKSRKK